LMGWCLSAFSFMIEVLYKRVLSKKSWILECLNCLLIQVLRLLHRSTSPTTPQSVHLPDSSEWISHAYKLQVWRIWTEHFNNFRHLRDDLKDCCSL
jgi:hypothetical protein